MVLSFFFLGQELVVKESPNFIVSENKVQLNSLHELDFKGGKNLPLGFGIFDTDRLVPYDKTYFKIFGEKRSYYYRVKGNYFDSVTVRFAIEKCTRDEILNEYGPGRSEEEYQYLMTLSVCLTNQIEWINSTNPEIIPSAQKESHLNIKGLFGAQNHSFIVIKFAKCRNSSTFKG